MKWLQKQWNRVKEVIHRLVCSGIFYALWLLPRDKHLVVFGAEEGIGFGGNPKYLFLEAQKHPEIRCVWITKDPRVLELLTGQNFEAYLANSWKGSWIQLRAGTAIFSHSIKDDFSYLLVGGATSVNTWHGVGLKRSWFRNVNTFSGLWYNSPPSLKRTWHLLWARTNMTRNSYVIGTSEEVDAYYPDTYSVPADHVLCLGQARNDVFFDDSLEDSKIPELFRNGKVIVYMPTHRNYGEKHGAQENIGSEIDYEKLSAVLKKYGYTFVVKQHRFNTHASAFEKSYDNIVDISLQNYSMDTQTILKYTDILISDYSSVYTDYLLLDRPVAFYCYDLEEYLALWDLNFPFDYVTPGPIAKTSDELIDALEKLMQGQDGYEAERQRVKRVFYSPENQGPVAKKQMEYILKNIIGV